MATIEGRAFSEEILSRIRELVQTTPTLSRMALSREVCRWLDWRSPSGRLQEMSCRKALAKLERAGLIRQPEPACEPVWKRFRAPVAPPPIAVVDCPLSELGAIEVVLVTRELSAWWTSMMDAHHYLRSGPLCGSQLRYMVRSERYGWLGGLSFSACALKLEVRDRWIGWTSEARRQTHIYLVNNSRFLIAPTVRVKNLASRVLALAAERLPVDWEERYQYRPVMLETYVDRERFGGTCYRAAGWIRLGPTAGRGRRGTGATVKDVYVKPLAADWQARLCRRPDGSILVERPPEPPPPRDWVEAELGGAHLGDRRLTARLLQMTGLFYGKPGSSVCGSGPIAAAKAAYRFLDNPNVDWQAILAPHHQSTERRLAEDSLALVVQDTSYLNFTSHPATQGLGPIGTQEQDLQGLVLHCTAAFGSDGVPLGLLEAQCWAREGIGSRHERYEKPIEEKESAKWLEGYRAVSAVQNRCRRTRLVMVADREADIHEVFAEHAATRWGAQLLIRAERSRNRKVIEADESTEFLWEALPEAPVLTSRQVLVAARKGRTERQATISVRALPVTLKPPKRKGQLAPVKMWAVYALEESPPAEVERLEWMLLTTVEVATAEDACQRLEWYERRWGIEVFYRILKSGCRVEERQLESAHRIKNCLAIDLVVAWRIHHLTVLGRETPDVPCTVYFTDSEWKALTTFSTHTTHPPATPPSLHEAVAMVGALGGHLGRAGDGDPGAEILWKGMSRLTDLTAAYELYR
jgi:hypothetical protein